jgi:putative phosphoribosyl transferase
MVLFADREDAGRKIAGAYDGPEEDLVVLGVARGGVPVGFPVALEYGGPLDVVTVRKLPIPWSPEMGFGAVAPDGSRVLNKDLLPSLRLSDEEIRSVSEKVLSEVERRQRVYRGGRGLSELEGKNVLLADDGLATGYTMIAAIEMARRKGAASVNVAVPVSPADTARRIEPLVDGLLVLHVQRAGPFAVASFYRDFHDMDDDEVLDYLKRARGDEPS